MDIVTVVDEDGEPIKEELEYTTIEPDQETAQLELKKLTEELKRQQEESNNITLTNYEEEQEENAIISLEELVRKSKDMYEANELTQYKDEGNEPISLQELEAKGLNKNSYDEPFIIENVIPEEDKVEIEQQEELREKVKLVDMDTVEVKEESTRFKSSPFISPVYGIESPTTNDLQLENTANYDKLDEEIKRTNEFLMTLKELQKKLD